MNNKVHSTYCPHVYDRIQYSMRSATDILNQHWDGLVPVPIATIAKKMGILVEEHNNMQVPCRVETSFGSVHRIVLNKIDTPTRKRFMMAHALARIILQQPWDSPLGAMTSSDFMDTTSNTTAHRANRFALDLLIPPQVVVHAIRTKKAKTLEDLTNMFGVSQAAMAKRLKTMDGISA